jgi:hypothetical protein
MSEIADFITAQYDRIAQKARAASVRAATWDVRGTWHLEGVEHNVVGEEEAFCHPHNAEHIAIHDPAHVLADIESKRAILKMFTPSEREPETDEELHARCSHPSYEYKTTEGQRKAWDDADVPPEGEGWERNVDKGYGEGWARLDYTEESYWRRRLPAGQERVEKEPLVLRLLAAPFAGEPRYEEDWTV